ncbi:MAG: DUF3006 domain-containing protein [Moorellaceae bacterium]
MVKKQPPLIIERMEGEFAYIRYNNGLFNLPKALLPRAAREGDRLKIAIVLEPATPKPRPKLTRPVSPD